MYKAPIYNPRPFEKTPPAHGIFLKVWGYQQLVRQQQEAPLKRRRLRPLNGDVPGLKQAVW